MSANETIGNLLKYLPAAFFRQSSNGAFQEISPGIEQLTGLLDSDVVKDASPLLAAVHEEDREAFRHNSAKGESADWCFRIWHARTGELRTIRELRIPSEQGSTGLWVDNTDLSRLQNRLEIGAWKQALSTITLGIAHDFNNALTGLNGMTDLLRAQANESHPFYEPLLLIQQSVRKANDLVRRLNQLHESVPGKTDYCDLRQVVTEVLDGFHKATPSHVRVKRSLNSEPLPVYADSWRLRLAITELFLNGMEAMTNEGILEVQTTREQEAPKESAAFGALPRGPWVRLRIQAHGSKPLPEVTSMPKWFTTKVNAHGAGLGFFIVRRFCEESGAAFFSRDEDGGATELWLSESNFTEAEAAKGGPKRLLIASNPQSLAVELARLLRGQGYTGMVSPGLAEVRCLLAVNSKEFDALVIAASAGEIQEISQWLKAQKLSLKTVFLTDSQDFREADLVMPYTDAETLLRRLKSLFA
ncbi:MAG TPA: hypothetical protein VMZ27_07780 [Candidatus Saccharimonadales bacterium]|nr:hypothetical protein [Candidatus Saccharimonadales bacterium]